MQDEMDSSSYGFMLLCPKYCMCKIVVLCSPPFDKINSN